MAVPVRIRPRGGRRRAFTLLEIVMFSAIGGGVMYIAYNIFVASAKQGVNLDAKLKAVQGAQLLLERLERDLKHMVFEQGRYELSVSEDGSRVRFYMFDGHGADMADGVIPIHLREYRFDPALSRVMIDNEPYAPAFFRAVEFQLGSAGGAGTQDRPVLTMRVGGVADELAGLPEANLDLKTRSDFVSSVGLEAVAAARRTPRWRSSLAYRVR